MASTRLQYRAVDSRGFGIVIAFLLTGSTTIAQSQSLAMVGFVRIEKNLGIHISTKDEPRCDSVGNRVFPTGARSELTSSLVRISPEGTTLTRILLNSAPGFERAEIEDFSDGPDNTTYVLARQISRSGVTRDEKGRVSGSIWRVGSSQLLFFGADGVFISATALKVPPGTDVMAFAVFPDGNLFAVFRANSRDSFGGIFTPEGDLVRTVRIPDDLNRKERKGKYFGIARDGVRLRVGDDGNVYLKTGRYFPKLSVFSADGSLVTSHDIEIPEGVDDLWLEQFSQGKMVAELISRAPVRTERVFAIFDAATGTILNRLRFPASARDNFLICYSADTDTLSFLADSGDRIDLFRPATQ